MHAVFGGGNGMAALVHGMRNIRLVVAYDGSNYHGFQKQKRELTVQGVLEETLSKLCGGMVTVHGSGRTDAGVHALAQTVSFRTSGRIPTENIVRAAASLLPSDIAVLSACEVSPDFHARFSAHWKRYGYRIVCNEYNDPFLVRYAWQLREKPDVQAMNGAAAQLVGTHDFSAFRSGGRAEDSSVRTIYEAFWDDRGGELYFRIAGNGFLYHMVRNIVWMLIQLGTGRYAEADFLKQLLVNGGHFVGAPAPAAGLYLERVFYEPYVKKVN